jgi:hypothetical protein
VRHSASDPAFHTVRANQGAMDEIPSAMTRIDTIVRIELNQPENRFSRSHLIAPFSVSGGSRCGDIWLRT